VAARPVHLAIVDGIRSMTSGETARQTNTAVSPGVLIAGNNCVCTDAVGTAVMGFDPMSMRGAKPFEDDAVEAVVYKIEQIAEKSGEEFHRNLLYTG
jgi:uncharacterized protein (DUF362 family)